jgi:hypothetical protein
MHVTTTEAIGGESACLILDPKQASHFGLGSKAELRHLRTSIDAADSDEVWVVGKNVVEIGISLNDERVMWLKRPVRVVEHGVRHRIGAVLAEVLDVAIREEHPAVMRVDQPKQFEELLLYIGVTGKDERLPSRLQGVLHGKVDERLIGEVARTLGRDEPLSRTQMLLDLVCKVPFFVRVRIAAVLPTEHAHRNFHPPTTDRQEGQVVVEDASPGLASPGLSVLTDSGVAIADGSEDGMIRVGLQPGQQLSHHPRGEHQPTGFAQEDLPKVGRGSDIERTVITEDGQVALGRKPFD